MKKIRLIITVLLVLTMVNTNSLTVFGEEIGTYHFSENAYDKIDPILKEALENTDDNVIPVSVWFKDIDHKVIKEKVEEKLSSEVESGRITQETIDMVFFDDLNNNALTPQAYLSVSSEIDDSTEKILVEQAKKVIACERSISADLYCDSNSIHLSRIKDCLSLSDEKLSSCIMYSCKYAPNIEMCLTNEQIMDIVTNDDIDYIYYINSDNVISEEIETAIERNDDLNRNSEETFDTTFYSVTGLNSARDVWGLSGNGMKVGMLEAEGIIDTSLITTHTSQMHKLSSTSYSYSNHANTVAKLMVGYLDGYTGAIPHADLYYDSITYYSYGNNNIKQRIEQLIDEDVTAINCSFCIYNPNDPSTQNTYGDYAKWYDHVSIQHNVHLILSSGNYGSTGVPFSNMSYNAIVVGNCDNNGNIFLDPNTGEISSSYCSNNPLPYRPDIVAPGANIHVIPNYTASGTSFSAPLVTASVIQMAQVDALLLSNPRLMKSRLISSSRITSGMSNDPIYSSVGNDNIALSRVYGAGMLNVQNAHADFITNHYYNLGVLSKYSTTTSFDSYLRRVSGKKLRVCLTWDKINTVSNIHSSGTINESDLDSIKLVVTDPNGNTYASAYEYDNKQMITFIAQTNGYYHFKIERISSSFATNNNVNYAITWSAYK